MIERKWIERPLIEAIHDRQIAEHGGTSGLRDEGVLESALARAKHVHAYGGAEIDMPGLAAAYAWGLSRNHAFVDGNKRTAAVVCEVFLELNDSVLLAEDAQLYPAFIAIAADEMSEEQLAHWLRARVHPDSVNDPATGYRVSRSLSEKPAP